MRYPIWKKDDHFEFTNGPRIEMDPEVCDISAEELPLTWQFDWNRTPSGKVTDLRLEDGEITGEVEFFDEDFNDQSMVDLGCRIAGYYIGVERRVIVPMQHEKITKCTLKGTSIISNYQSPGWPGAKAPEGTDV